MEKSQLESWFETAESRPHYARKTLDVFLERLYIVVLKFIWVWFLLPLCIYPERYTNAQVGLVLVTLVIITCLAGMFWIFVTRQA